VRKIKEVLRLKFDVGLGLRQIARSCSIGLGTAHEYLQRAEAANITWPLGPEWDDDRLEAALFGGPPRSRPAVLPMPDFADLHRQRQQHSHLTQQLLWEEYRQANPDGYQYSRFCELYQRWRRKQDVVLRQEHKAGEKLFVDWAGTTIPVHDPRGGPVQQAHLFVAVLGASSYTYAEATADEQLASWIGAHVRAFEFYSGLPNRWAFFPVGTYSTGPKRGTCSRRQRGHMQGNRDELVALGGRFCQQSYAAGRSAETFNVAAVMATNRAANPARQGMDNGQPCKHRANTTASHADARCTKLVRSALFPQ
jgi:hypothetical protein